jgi:hypothetical protein
MAGERLQAEAQSGQPPLVWRGDEARALPEGKTES